MFHDLRWQKLASYFSLVEKLMQKLIKEMSSLSACLPLGQGFVRAAKPRLYYYHIRPAEPSKIPLKMIQFPTICLMSWGSTSRGRFIGNSFFKNIRMSWNLGWFEIFLKKIRNLFIAGQHKHNKECLRKIS